MPDAVMTVIASIPSPSFNKLEIGPLTLRLYGLCIALGVIAAIMIASRRWQERGGDPDDIGAIAIWAVPAGVVGARLYHVATDWKTYRDDWLQAFNITNGGLGIPGGVLLGTLVGLWVARRKHLTILPLMDAVAPAIPVAQAIGRLGNWFNQELFGRPTSLPWGLKINPSINAVAGEYPAGTLFHPTFLYEALWNLALAGLLIWLDSKRRLRAGELFTLYVLGYAVGRLWVEELRIDPASLLLGIRVNIWMSVLVALGAATVFVRNRRKPIAATDPTPNEQASDTNKVTESSDADKAPDDDVDNTDKADEAEKAHEPSDGEVVSERSEPGGS